jgi:hypothetical protein
MTRNEAISWLQSVGMKASARDWSLGETIAIPIGKPDIAHGIGIAGYPDGVLYICPQENGHWYLLDCYHLDNRTRVDGFDLKSLYSDLESAMHAAKEYISKVEQA